MAEEAFRLEQAEEKVEQRMEICFGHRGRHRGGVRGCGPVLPTVARAATNSPFLTVVQELNFRADVKLRYTREAP